MFHLFSNRTQDSLWAATDDRSGPKLPTPNQWIYRKTVTQSRIGFDANAAAAAIQTQGYYLFTVAIEVTEVEVAV